MHTLPNHSCFVLKATAASLTQSVHSFLCSWVLLNTVVCALPSLSCFAPSCFSPNTGKRMWCWEGHLGRVRRCRVVCNQIVCVGYPKCFPEAGAKQRINPFQLMPLPGNVSASYCLSKLGEWQWIGKEHLYCKSMISQLGVIICTRPFCSRLFPWLQKYRPLLPPIIIFPDLVKPLQWGLLEQTFFGLSHPLPTVQLYSTADTHWEHLAVTNCCCVRLGRKRMIPFREEE